MGVQDAIIGESQGADIVLARIARLVRRARTRDVPVVWVRHGGDVLPEGSEGWQFVSRLTPLPGEPIIDKAWADAFAETELSDVLAELGVSEFVLCGAQSDACVRSTFFGGIHRGYSVTLVADAHTTGDYRPWDVGYSPDEARRVLNGMAASTRQPGVAGSTITTEEAFA